VARTGEKRFWLGNLAVRDHLEDLRLYGIIIPKSALKKSDKKEWTEFVSLKMGALVNAVMNQRAKQNACNFETGSRILQNVGAFLPTSLHAVTHARIAQSV
jgi:hypothetical protein